MDNIQHAWMAMGPSRAAGRPVTDNQLNSPLLTHCQVCRHASPSRGRSARDPIGPLHRMGHSLSIDSQFELFKPPYEIVVLLMKPRAAEREKQNIFEWRYSAGCDCSHRDTNPATCQRWVNVGQRCHVVGSIATTLDERWPRVLVFYVCFSSGYWQTAELPFFSNHGIIGSFPRFFVFSSLSSLSCYLLSTGRCLSLWL